MRRTRRTARFLVMTGLVGSLLALGTGAWAHPHNVATGSGDLQVIANGQNHPAFTSGLSCDTDGSAGSAWYGLETAHHGPDAGQAGRGLGGEDAAACYQTTGGVAPGADVQNPVIQ
jgi:hypothetical protein